MAVMVVMVVMAVMCNELSLCWGYAVWPLAHRWNAISYYFMLHNGCSP
jgi:hypothetical protein